MKLRQNKRVEVFELLLFTVLLFISTIGYPLERFLGLFSLRLANPKGIITSLNNSVYCGFATLMLFVLICFL